jgi:hypothetical protein
MHWVYILKDTLSDHLYIGETTRLFRRLFEHKNANGSKITSKGTYDRLVGLYKIPINSNFYLYHRQNKLYNDYNPFLFENMCERTYNTKEEALLIENWITELLITNKDHDGEYDMVYGGKYCNLSTYYNMIERIQDEDVLKRPFCKCGIPAEIRMSSKNELYYICSMQNVWDGIHFGIDIEESCDFYMKYDDTESKVYYSISKKYRNEPFFGEIPRPISDITPGNCVMCKKTSYLPVWSPTYGSRRICSECMSNDIRNVRTTYTTCMID